MDSPQLDDQGVSLPCETINHLKRDRFELLSAYLDGEVTADERRQVQQWLDSDPTVQCLYDRLLKLRQVMRTIPVPPPECSAEKTTQRVFRKLNHRRHRLITWGGVAIAAMFVGFLSHLTPTHQPSAPQIAAEPANPDVTSDALMIALDRPILEIPKVPVSSPDGLTQPSLYNSIEPIR